MNTNDTKSVTMESIEKVLQLLKEVVDTAEMHGIPKDWSEDFVIAHLPAIFRREPK